MLFLNYCSNTRGDNTFSRGATNSPLAKMQTWDDWNDETRHTIAVPPSSGSSRSDATLAMKDAWIVLRNYCVSTQSPLLDLATDDDFYDFARRHSSPFNTKPVVDLTYVNIAPRLAAEARRGHTLEHSTTE